MKHKGKPFLLGCVSVLISVFHFGSPKLDVVVWSITPFSLGPIFLLLMKFGSYFSDYKFA